MWSMANGSLGNCMLKIPTSRTFFWTKTLINVSTVVFYSILMYLKVGFATRLFHTPTCDWTKKRQVQRISSGFCLPMPLFGAGLPHLKKISEEFSVYSNEWSPCTISSFHSWAQSLECPTALWCSFWPLGVAVFLLLPKETVESISLDFIGFPVWRNPVPMCKKCIKVLQFHRVDAFESAEVMSIYSILGQEFFMLHGANYTYTNESWPNESCEPGRTVDTNPRSQYMCSLFMFVSQYYRRKFK